MTNDSIFSGLKVVDLASFIAAILSDFGADVIKVEPPSGELWRHAHNLPPQPVPKTPTPGTLPIAIWRMLRPIAQYRRQ